MRKKTYILVIFVMSFLLFGCADQQPEKERRQVPEEKSFDTDVIQQISEKNRVEMEKMMQSVNQYEATHTLDYKAGEKESCYAVRYKMDLKLQQKEKKISGKIQFTVENHTKDALSEICIRNYASSILKEYRRGESKIFNCTVNGRKDGLSLYIKKKDSSVLYLRSEDVILPAGGSAVADLEFTTSIPKKKDRFGYTKYNGKEFYRLSFCFPTASVYENGKWNENPYINSKSESNFAKCADYDVTVQTPEGFTVIATGQETGEGRTTQIQGKSIRELAMVVSNGLRKKSGSIKGVTVNCYGLDYDKNEKYNKLILQAAMDSVELYTDLIGAYPYKEFDVVLAFMKGGMEYPGMVMVGLPDSAESKQYKNLDQAASHDLVTCCTVAHETAHQWFYGTVGNDPYREPWLDEAFAEYCENMLYLQSGKRSVADCANDVGESDTGTMGRMSKKEFEDWMKIVLDQTEMKKSIDGRLDSYEIEEDEYSRYVYEGGSHFLYELCGAMGNNKFFHVLRAYYKTYYLKEATKEDFLGLIRKIDRSEKVERIIKKYTRE